MFADVLVPPTFVFDWYVLDAPFGVMAFLSVTAGLISLFFLLVSRRMVRNKAMAILVCVGLFVLADLFVYAIGSTRPRRPRPDREPPAATQPAEKQ